MIRIVSTAYHQYTQKLLQSRIGRTKLRFVSYDALLRPGKKPGGTYIFTDFDRLAPFQRELAARAYRALEAGGARVLNDPAEFRERFALLRHLKNTGINDFAVWSPELGEFPDRFPVFLRTRAAHRSTITDLLEDETAAQDALSAALEEGYPRGDLMFVEFAATPVDSGNFQKRSHYRMGDRFVPALTTNEGHWRAKFGTMGIATDERYEEEVAEAREGRYLPFVRRAFDAAGIAFGRIDFGLWNGRPQVYEINTNPSYEDVGAHRHPGRSALILEQKQAMTEALLALDTAEAGSIDMPYFRKASRRTRGLRVVAGTELHPI